MSIGLNQYIIKMDKSEKSRNMITALILMLDIEKASHLANDGLHKNSNDSIDLLASINFNKSKYFPEFTPEDAQQNNIFEKEDHFIVYICDNNADSILASQKALQLKIVMKMNKVNACVAFAHHPELDNYKKTKYITI